MRQRGRKSSQDLAVKPVLAFTKRMPPPPQELDPDEAEVWRKVVATAVGDMLDQASYPLLSEFCKVCVSLRIVGNEARRFRPEWATSEEGLRRWDCLLRMQDRLQARLSSLATKLRISPQTRVHKSHASMLFDNHIDPDRPTPWNFDGEKIS